MHAYPKKNKKYQILQNFLKKAIKSSQDNVEVVKGYVLSILNSSLGEFLLKLGKKPSQGGYYSLSEKSLESIPLPIDEEKTDIAKGLVEIAKELLCAEHAEKTLMDKMEEKVWKMFDLNKDDIKSIWQYLQKH